MAEKKTTVLVGTYWTGQFDRWHGYYNYPIADADVISESDCRSVTELWLFKGVSEPRYREAEVLTPSGICNVKNNQVDAA